MDSEHRHELEENWLAGKLTTVVEDIKPQLPAIGLGLAVLVVGLIAMNGWKASAAASKAERWRDFTVAVEGARPNLDLLKAAAEANAGTDVEDWSLVTWADGRLWDASRQYLRDRAASDEAAGEAIEIYERLVASKDRLIAERAAYQLGRAYELQGDLDKAKQQYGRVTGAFSDLATARVEELASGDLADDYEWLASVKTATASSTIDLAGDAALEPDDIELPEADAEATLDELLGAIEEPEADETPAADEATATEEAAEAAIEETASE